MERLIERERELEGERERKRVREREGEREREREQKGKSDKLSEIETQFCMSWWEIEGAREIFPAKLNYSEEMKFGRFLNQNFNHFASVRTRVPGKNLFHSQSWRREICKVNFSFILKQKKYAKMCACKNEIFLLVGWFVGLSFPRGAPIGSLV